MKEEQVKAKIYKLVDGPRGGTSMRLVYPPCPYLRLAFPEWCTYEYDKTSQTYLYVGNKPIPKDVYDSWSGFHEAD